MILKYRFPVHIITKSDLVVRDFDLLSQIEQQAILPPDLEGKLKRKVFITFSFSTIDDNIARIFEPGATPPSVRLNTLRQSAEYGFKTGVSMMPLLPYITDTGSHLIEMFSAFKQAGAQYVFPATITLFGSDRSDSKTLVMKAVEKHYPHLFGKYHQLFDNNTSLPDFYNRAFADKAKELSAKYGLANSLL